jgi:acyl carrier protein
VAFRDGKRYVARLMPISTPLSTDQPLISDGSYLITGGLGALGLTLAEWLVQQGARHLVLTSRQGLLNQSEEKQQKIRALENQGATIKVVAADVSDYQQMSQLFAQIQLNSPNLRGIIHAAGVLNDCSISQMDLETFAKVFQPKVTGAWNLHQLTQDLSLDFFVCFSSMSALLGSRGQLHYAAANSFLDGLIYHRQTLGLPGLSINWGPWAEGGMATQGYEVGLKRMGIEPLEPTAALQVLGGLLGSASVQTMVAAINWSAFGKIVAAKGRVAFLEALLTQESQDGGNGESFCQKLAAAPLHRRAALLTTQVQQEVALVLGHSGSYVPEIEQGFFDMGMDSLMSVQLRHSLEALLAVSLPSTLVFECPTIGDVVSYLMREVFAWQLDASDESAMESPASVVIENTIAQLEGLSTAETEALMEQELAELQALLS